jgi:hypothetical protein
LGFLIGPLFRGCRFLFPLFLFLLALIQLLLALFIFLLLLGKFLLALLGLLLLALSFLLLTLGLLLALLGFLLLPLGFLLLALGFLLAYTACGFVLLGLFLLALGFLLALSFLLLALLSLLLLLLGLLLLLFGPALFLLDPLPGTGNFVLIPDYVLFLFRNGLPLKGGALVSLIGFPFFKVNHTLAVVNAPVVGLTHLIDHIGIGKGRGVNGTEGSRISRPQGYGHQGLAGPLIKTYGKTRFFLNHVLDNRGFIPGRIKVPVFAEYRVINRHIPGQEGRVSGGIIIGPLEITLDNQPEVPDMIHPDINSQPEDIRVKLVPLRIGNGMDDKVTIGSPCLAGPVFYRQSQLIADIADLRRRIYPGMGPLIVDEVDVCLIPLQFTLIHILGKKAVEGGNYKNKCKGYNFFHSRTPWIFNLILL